MIAASPDQSLLAVSFGRALAQPVALYSTRDWTKLADLDDPRKAARRSNVLTFSEHGKFLAVDQARTVLIYDLASRQIVRRINSFPDGLCCVSAIAFSPDGNRIAVGFGSLASHRRLPDGSIETIPPKDLVHVFGIKDGSPVAVYPNHSIQITALHGARTAACSPSLRGYRTLHLWDPFRPGPSDLAIDLSRGPDSLVLASSPDADSWPWVASSSVEPLGARDRSTPRSSCGRSSGEVYLEAPVC